MSVAVWSGSLVAWARELAALKARIGPVSSRAEVRATAGAFLDGLLSGVARKTGWLLAEQAGLDRPDRMQSLLRTAAARTQMALWETIGTLLDDFKPVECQNYIVNSG